MVTVIVTINDIDIIISRYLQTLNSISAEKNSTIIFPLPMEMLGHFMARPRSPRRTSRK